MMFSEFSWPGAVVISIAVLPNPNNHFFDSLLKEAEERGLHHEGNTVWGCLATIKMQKGREISFAVMGAEVEPHSLPDRWVMVMESDVLGKSPSIAVWHMILRLYGNPIELHVKWSPIDGDHMAFLNVHAAENREQLSAMPALIDALNFIKAQRGRRKGSIKPSPEQFDRMKNDAIRYRELEWSWEDIAAALEIDLGTLASYRKKWGINSD